MTCCQESAKVVAAMIPILCLCLMCASQVKHVFCDRLISEVMH